MRDIVVILGMSLFAEIRRSLAYRLYARPEPVDSEGSLSTRGIMDTVLDTNEKRDVIRQLATENGERHRYSLGDGGIGLSAVSERVVRAASLDVSTRRTDYDDFEVYLKTVREARLAYMRESVLPDLVNTLVLEVIEPGGEWVADMDDVHGEIMGVRPGRRFEVAVQALRWIDELGSQYDWNRV